MYYWRLSPAIAGHKTKKAPQRQPGGPHNTRRTPSD